MKCDHPAVSLVSLTLGVIGVISLHTTTVFAQVYQANADTAQMAWGHQDYTRYNSAGYCDRVVAEVSYDYKRVYIPDTSAVSLRKPPNTLLPDALIAAARACGDRFTVESADPRDLWSLMRLSLVLGKDAQARAAVERLVSLRGTPGGRAFVMGTAIPVFLSAIPSRLLIAEEYLKRLDAMGDTAKNELMNAHMGFAAYWYIQYNNDRRRVHADRAIALWKTMKRTEQDANPQILMAYEHLLNIANDAGDLVLQEKILEQAVADRVGEWRDGQGEGWIDGMVRLIERKKAVYGKQTRPLEGDFWFNHQGVPQPAPGKMSLLIYANNGCLWTCHAFNEMIQGLKAQYGADLEITLILSTSGSLPGSGPLTPVEYAEGAARLILTFLRLPVVVLIGESPVDTLSDGRLRRRASKVVGFFPGAGTNCAVVDREGKIQWFGTLQYGRSDRRLLEAVLNRISRGDPPRNATDSSAGIRP